MAVSQIFAHALAADRKAFNARVAAARVRAPGFAIDRFTAFLEQQVDPLVMAVAAQDPDAVQRCATAMFDMGVELIIHGLVANGGQASLAIRIWGDIAPGIVALIARDPAGSLGSLTNAAIQMGAIDGARGEEWLAMIAILAPEARDSRELRALAAMAAWRSGASHFRDGALAVAGTLPPILACAAVGASGDDWAMTAGAYARDRWWRPGGMPPASKSGCLVGKFTGFGGRFGQPPRVRACEQGFFVASGDHTFLLIADTYGATLHKASAEEFSTSPELLVDAHVSILGNSIVAEDRHIPLEWPADGLALACNRDSIAVTSPYSHGIAIFPRRLA